MKSTALSLLTAFVLAVICPAASWAALDSVDELLGIESAVPQSGPAPTLLEHDYSQPADEVRQPWHPESPAPHVVRPSHGTSLSATSASQHPKSAPSAPFSAVPEPSALLLAVAALVYFLVFGRRRRLI